MSQAPGNTRWYLLVALGIGIFFWAPPRSRAADALEIKPSHPRVWLNPERLTRLKKSAAANTARWQKLKTRADAALKAPKNQTADIPLLALAYQVTRQPAYAEKAIQVLLAQLPKIRPAADSYYGYRMFMPDIIAGYDWCYERLKTEERQRIARWLMDRSDEVWPETNPKRAGGWAVHDAANNYFYGFLMTWPAALAVHGDDARAQRHIDLALSKYRQQVRHFSDGWGAGGVFPESTNYDSAFRLASILDAHWTATGQDLINENGFYFLRDSLYWRIHATVPTRDFCYPLGDQSRVSLAPLSDYDRQRALVPAATVKDKPACQYAKYWLDSIKPPISQWAFTQVTEFLYYDEHRAALDYTKQLPTYYFAAGPGLLVKRSSWKTDATYWGIWAGPLRESHQNGDVNGFLIYKGGWLAGNASIWSHSGILNRTINHNNLTIDGKNQAPQPPNARWPNEAGRTLKYEDTPEYTYFVGSAAQAYVQDRAHGGKKLVNDYVRKLVYINPDLFLIYDRVHLVDPRLTKEWHLQSKKPIAIQDRVYSFDNGKYRLTGQLLLPRTGFTLEHQPIHGGAKKEVSSYRLDVITKDNQATDYLLNVLQIAPLTSGTSLTAQAIRERDDRMEGAQIQDWAVLFGKKELIASPVSYQVPKGTPARHLLLDLQPSARYRLAIRDAKGAIGRTVAVATTEKGSLRFDAHAGETQFTLTPQGALTPGRDVQQ